MNIRDRFDKFTERAKRVLVLAQEEARLLQHSYLGTEHLLLGLLREGDGVAAKVLQTCALDLEKLRSTTEEVVGRGDRVETGEIKMTADTRRAIELAIEQAQRMNHQYIGTEHLLLGLLRLPECDATEILQNQGISLEMIRVRTLRMLKAMAASYGEAGQAHTFRWMGVAEEQATSFRAMSSPEVPKAPLSVSSRERFDRFTERARKVLSLAQEEAQRFQHNYIGTEHLLLGLVREGEGIAARVLLGMGIELSRVRGAVEFIIGRGDRIVLGEIGLTPRAKKVIELAVDEARSLNHHYIGTEHLLLGLVREGEGIAAGVLQSLGVTLPRVREEVMRVLTASEAAREQLAAEQRVEVQPVNREFERYRFTQGGQHVLRFAQEEAWRFRHGYVSGEHLLVGLLREREGMAAEILRDAGLQVDQVRKGIEALFGRGVHGISSDVELTPRAWEIVRLASEEAQRGRKGEIGTEHLLLALVSLSEGVPVNVFAYLGIELKALREKVIRALNEGQDKE